MGLGESRKDLKMLKIKKLRQKKGETLVEVLVSLLIVCLCLFMLATSINGAVTIIDSANKKMNRYYERNNALSTGLVAGEYSEGSVTYKNGDSDCILVDGEPSTVEVKYYTNEVFEDSKVIAYVRK